MCSAFRTRATSCKSRPVVARLRDGRADGHQLYFLSIDRQLMAVPITLTDRFQAGPPSRLFDAPIGLGENRYVPSLDGTHFLLSVPASESSAPQIVVALNWAGQLANSHAGH